MIDIIIDQLIHYIININNIILYNSWKLRLIIYN